MSSSPLEKAPQMNITIVVYTFTVEEMPVGRRGRTELQTHDITYIKRFDNNPFGAIPRHREVINLFPGSPVDSYTREVVAIQYMGDDEVQLVVKGSPRFTALLSDRMTPELAAKAAELAAKLVSNGYTVAEAEIVQHA